jgi:hypothetical protein
MVRPRSIVPTQRFPIGEANECCAVVNFRWPILFFFEVSGLRKERKPATERNLIIRILQAKEIRRSVSELVNRIEGELYLDSRRVEAWRDGY